MTLTRYAFEVGPDGTAATTTNVPASIVTSGTGGSVLYKNSAAWAGSYGLQFNSVSAAQSLVRLTTTEAVSLSFSARIKLPAATGSARSFVIFRRVGGAAAYLNWNGSSTLSILNTSGAGATSLGTGLSLDTWYKVTVTVTRGTTTSNGQFSAKLYSADGNTLLGSATSTTFNTGTALMMGVDIGMVTAVAGSVQFDEVYLEDSNVEIADRPAVNTAEGGVDGATVTNAGSAAGGNAFTAIAGGPVWSSEQFQKGSRSFKFANGSGMPTFVGYQDTTSTGAAAIRGYVYLTAYPTATRTLMSIGVDDGAGGMNPVVGFGISSLGRMALFSSTSGTWEWTDTTGNMPLNTWIRIELSYVPNSFGDDPYTIAWFLGDSTTASRSRAASTPVSSLSTPTFGAMFGPRFDSSTMPTFYMDDLAFQRNSANLIGPSVEVIPPKTPVSAAQTQNWTVNSMVPTTLATTWDVLPATRKSSTGFNSGVAGDTITSTNGGSMTQFAQVDGAPIFDMSRAVSVDNSMRVPAGTLATAAHLATPEATDSVAARGYFWLPTGAPASDIDLIRFYNGATVLARVSMGTMGEMFTQIDSRIAQNMLFALPKAQWIRIEARYDHTAGSLVTTVYSLDSLTPLSTYSNTGMAQTPTNTTKIAFGKGATANSVPTFYVDDISVQSGSSALIGPSMRRPAVFMDTAWDVKTSVSVSNAQTYNVRAQILKAQSGTWDVRTQITDSESASWDTRERVGYGMFQTWSTRQSAESSVSTTWNTKTTVSVAAGTSWNTEANALRVEAMHATSWNVGQSINSSISESWNSQSRVVESETTEWGVYTSATRSLATSWDIDITKSTVAANAPTSWSINAFVSETETVEWAVRSRVSDSQASNWEVRARTFRDDEILWDVRTSTLSEPQYTEWDVRELVGDSFIDIWVTDAQISHTFTTNWRTRSLLSSIYPVTVRGPGNSGTSSISNNTVAGIIGGTTGTAARAGTATSATLSQTSTNAALNPYESIGDGS